MIFVGTFGQARIPEIATVATPINLSVIKAFDTLDLFSVDRPEVTADIVARELGMTYPTAHRFLTTLEAADIVSATRRGAFAPGPRLARLGRMAEDLAPVPPNLQETLDGLSTALNESVMACRYTPRGPLCVAVSAADRPISVNIRTGTTLPMLATAQGRLWLSAMTPAKRAAWAQAQGVTPAEMDAISGVLNAIAAQGHALNQGDNEPDIAALSVPVSIDGHMGLTMSVFGMLSRFDAALLGRAEKLLKDAAKTLAH